MRKKVLFVTITLLAAALLSGCAGGPARGVTWPGLAADENAAYLADGPHVYAVSLRDGRELWRYPAQSDRDFAFYSAPAITPDGLVVIGSSGANRSLIALDPNKVTSNNGINSPAVAWTFSGAGDHWFAPPLVVDDRLFAVNADGFLYVLSLQEDGSTREALRAVEIGGRLWAQPTTDGERLFLTSLDHSVIAVDIQTYEILWHEDIEGAVAGSAVLGPDGMLYVGSLASRLERFDPETGEHTAVVNAEDWIWSTPSLDGDTLYFGDVKGNVYSFNVSTGSLNWPTVKPDEAITASPLPLGDSVLVATESGAIFEVSSEDGRSTLWSQPGGKIYTSPVKAGDVILVAPLGTEGYLYAYKRDGSLAWQPFTPAN